jgi:CheY-like chemotaxis protein
MTMAFPLAGLRILLVEDDGLLSLLVEDALDDLGCSVVGPFTRLGPALELVRAGGQPIDMAVLDIDVAGEPSFGLAELLLDRSVPVILATGYDDAGLEGRWRVLPILRKPFSDLELKRVLEQVGGARAGRSPG